MQITLSSEQINWIRTAVGAISTIVAFWRILSKTAHWVLKQVIDSIHPMITENVNRGIKETKDYTDLQFLKHENSAFSRLDAQDIIINNLVEELKKINERLKNGH
jgi:hypothetical protein